MNLEKLIFDLKDITTKIINENYKIDLSDIETLKETYIELFKTFNIDDFEVLSKISDEIANIFTHLDENSFKVYDDGIEVNNDDVYIQIEKIITLLVNLIKIIKDIDIKGDRENEDINIDDNDIQQDNNDNDENENEDEYDISFEKFMELFNMLDEDDINDIKQVVEFFILFNNTIKDDYDILKEVYENALKNLISNEETIIENTVDSNDNIDKRYMNEVADNVDNKIEIVKPDVEVDTTPWIKVNKDALKKEIYDMYVNKKYSNIEEVIDEVYALVRCYDDMKCWKYPHHIIKDDKVILNINGLRTAVLFFVRMLSTNNHDYSKEEIKKMAEHFARHYKELNREIPSTLSKYLNKSEKYIMFNISDDELIEASTLFDNNLDITLSYIFAIESLINVLENTNIIDISSNYIEETIENREDNELSIYTIKLTSKQLKEFMKLFDVFIEKAINIIDNKTIDFNKEIDDDYEKEYNNDLNFDDYLILKKQLEDIQLQVDEYTKTISKLKQEKEELLNQLNDVNKVIDELSMIEKKYNILVENILNGKVIDKTFIDMLNEASDDFELKALSKLSESISIRKNTTIRLTDEDMKYIENNSDKEKIKNEKMMNRLIFTALNLV